MKEEELGIVTHYFGHISVAIIKLRQALKVGDTIRIKGAHDDFIQVVDSIQIEHQNVEEAKENEVVGIKVLKKVHPNDKIYLAN